MNKRNILLAVALTASLSTSMPVGVRSLEMTAGGRTAQDNAGFEIRLHAATAALQGTLNKLLACNKKRMVFSPDVDDPDRDADGCVSVGGGSDQEYAMVEEDTTVAQPQACRGRNSCTVTLNMTPFADKKNVSVTASCDPPNDGWCRGPTSGTGSIPNMNANYSATILRAGGSKSCDIIATYTAASKQLVLTADYNGGSTDVKNGKYCSVKSVSVGYSVTKIKPVE